MKSCLIRADASSRMGTGHVMRCMALAEAWQPAEGRVVFFHAETTSALKQRLRDRGIEMVQGNFAPGSAQDAAQTIAQARVQGALWVVADGYQFGAGWQEQIKDAGLYLLLMDDYGHAGHYYADYVLNQNPSIDSRVYQSREAGTRLLLGPQFALLRPEFLSWRDWQREVPAVGRKVLLTLGGADPDNVTAKAIHALNDLDVQSKIVGGGSNPHLEQIKSEIKNRNSEIELVVDAADMPELMAWADCAIAAGGTTSLELAFMGLPSVVLALADNQRDIAAKIHEIGIGRSLGWHADIYPDTIAMELSELLMDQPVRERMSRCGRRLVDGLGAQRVVRLLEQPVERKRAHPDPTSVFPLASPKGGEGRGEEAPMVPDQIPSPQPSPRFGGERESGAVSGCAQGNPPVPADLPPF
jgi:UDP-2,4-diacetamido-2,4,6-trideoxy-beta-L-altropyranose hydrolase